MLLGTEETGVLVFLGVYVQCTHFILQEELVPADENLSQPLQDLCAVNHLVANQLLTDQEQDLRAKRFKR